LNRNSLPARTSPVCGGADSCACTAPSQEPLATRKRKKKGGNNFDQRKNQRKKK